jgi:hypothetical protein
VLLILYDVDEVLGSETCTLKEIGVEYSFLEREIRYRVGLEETFGNNVALIPMNKIQLLHFFVESHEVAGNVIKEMQKV